MPCSSCSSNAGAEPELAKAIAAQFKIASDAGEKNLIERIAETERRVTERTTSLLWRFFGAMVAVVTAAIAVLE